MITTEVQSEFFSGTGVLDPEKNTLTIKTPLLNFPLDTIFDVHGEKYKFVSCAKSLYIDSIVIIKVQKLL